MTEYWMLEVVPPEDRDIAQIGRQLTPSPQELLWYGGQRFDASLAEPLQFELDPRGGDYMPAFFAPPIPLMNVQMLAALSAAGVDNLQTYAATITDPRGAVTFNDYRATNVVGLVACADLSRSDCEIDDEEIPGGVTFNSLAIDLKRARSLLFFRLFEAPQGIVVHDSVRTKLIGQPLNGVVFLEPENWSG